MTVQSSDCVYMWDLFPTQKLSSQPHLFLFSGHFSALASKCYVLLTGKVKSVLYRLLASMHVWE